MSNTINPLASDLDHIVERTGDLWQQLRGARLFVTGGTGFVGRWMLESIVWANAKLGLDAQIVALSRDPQRFATTHPHIANAPGMTLVQGDMLTCEFPSGSFTHIVHMATETNTALSAEKPSLEFDTAVDGTRRIIEFALRSGAEAMLYTSSGAVYGRQPSEITHIAENEPVAPPAHDVGAAYSHGKRAAEFICAAANRETDLDIKIARLFAFVGPGLPMDAGYAVGNFIGDALAGRRISISGDGTPMRSYLYAADLAWWLWTILLAGEAGNPYNTGSDAQLSILELARTVDGVLGGSRGVDVAKEPVPGAPVARYVPDITRARGLGLKPAVSLEEGIRRTAAWHEAIASN